MPELPEVETIVKDLNKQVLSRTFVDVWTDFEKMIKKQKNFEEFKKELIGKKIKKIRRRGKNILFDLSKNKTLLIHQKLTGHLIVGKWKRVNHNWQPPAGPLSEEINTYIHLLFTLDNGQMLALSDLRKFAKVELWDRDELKDSKEFKSLGPEPLEKDFTFEKFKEVLTRKKGKTPRRTRGKIKQVLMNQQVITGIGNIYSDEILWESRVNPFRDVSRLSEAELKRIYLAIKKILEKAIELRGESISDFRDIKGRRGFFDKYRKVYRKEGEKCKRCGTTIKREKIGGRSTHFCPRCQKLSR